MANHHWNPRSPNSQVFKALTKEAIAQMQRKFYSIYQQIQLDDYYLKAYRAKQLGSHTFVVTTKLKSVKTPQDTAEPALGAVRLRHSSTSQPLVPPDSGIAFVCPFESTEQKLEEAWSYLLELEDMARQENPQQNRTYYLLRHIVNLLQFNTVSKSIDSVDPSGHQRFALYLSTPKGQRFFTRFLGIMPQSYLKRFFFTAFIVMDGVQIDARAEFGVAFVRHLIDFIQDEPSVKPKWLAAYVRQLARAGFAAVAGNELRAACLAILLTTIRHQLPSMDIGNAKLMKETVGSLANSIAGEIGAALKTDYTHLFMKSIVMSVCEIVPESKLRKMLIAVSI